jgi:hypothetical protein
MPLKCYALPGRQRLRALATDLDIDVCSEPAIRESDLWASLATSLGCAHTRGRPPSAITELIDAEVEAHRARDFDRFLAFFAEEVVGTSFDGSVLMRGDEELSSFYGLMFSNSPDLTAEIKSRIETGPFVFDLEHVEGLIHPSLPADP